MSTATAPEKAPAAAEPARPETSAPGRVARPGDVVIFGVEPLRSGGSPVPEPVPGLIISGLPPEHPQDPPRAKIVLLGCGHPGVLVTIRPYSPEPRIGYWSWPEAWR